MAKKRIKTAYLYGPIEFTSNPDSGWRYVLEKLLKPLGIKCINPVRVSYKVGKDIKDNATYVRKLKREGRLCDLDVFMDKIWSQNKKGVDPSDVLICWVGTRKELRALNSSGGSYRELCRGKRKGKRLFLICEAGLEYANSHLLHIIRSSGAIFEWAEELRQCLDYYNKTGKWNYIHK